MWDIIVVHLYSKCRKSLINKLFFSGRFISKRIRLLIVRAIRFISNNIWKMLLIILMALLYLRFKLYSNINFKWFAENSIWITIASAFMGYFLQLLPKKMKLSARLLPYNYPVTIQKGLELVSYQYYVMRIYNPTNKTLIIDKVFLTNGLFAKNYDVIYVNSNGKEPVQTVINEKNGYQYPVDGPTEQAVLIPNGTMVVKLGSSNSFRYAFIQDNFNHLHKVDVARRDFRAEYDGTRRGVFTTSDNKDEEKKVSEMKWVDEKKPLM
ncbi:hypothetical protein [Fructobacillus tropaeoli]|uniref:hypothetical protein n=1 Tax=Fructobacillus tropaeoli TaxID=709323 RepID=UPI002DA7DB56|nr:unnamed protein product [Fructobacillus tropaeoli]